MENVPEPQNSLADAEQPEIDMQALAEVIFELLRRELQIENERTGKM